VLGFVVAGDVAGSSTTLTTAVPLAGVDGADVVFGGSATVASVGWVAVVVVAGDPAAG